MTNRIINICTRIDEAIDKFGEPGLSPEILKELLEDARAAYDDLTTHDNELRAQLLNNWEWLNYAINFN